MEQRPDYTSVCQDFYLVCAFHTCTLKKSVNDFSITRLSDYKVTLVER